MTQEHKELLLQDLSTRLPYGIICDDGYGNVLELNGIDKPNTATFKCSDKTFWTTDLDKCKPYLFPLSSMTEEQTEELIKLINTGQNDNNEFMRSLCRIEFYHKNHFDYRGLIEKGLANDATGLTHLLNYGLVSSK